MQSGTSGAVARSVWTEARNLEEGELAIATNGVPG